MSHLNSLGRLGVAVLLLGACRPDTASTPTMAKAELHPAAAHALTVFAQNVYVGTDVDAVLTAPPEQLPAAIGAALATFLSTDWPARADAIAAKIVEANADAVALNELTKLTVTGLSPLLPEIYVDFLPVLMDRIAARGGAYLVGGLVANTDAKLSVGPGLIRLQDFDALLIREGVPFTTVAEQQFVARAPVDFGPLGSFELIRGFVAADLTLNGGRVRVVATHLEPRETAPALQSAQAAELLVWLDPSVPTIVAGDLNSTPTDLAAAAPYQQFAAAGFRDSWLERTGPRADPGFTCCHAGDLVNASPTMVKRIDFVLVRNPGAGRGATSAELFGVAQGDRLLSGLWPSDHAGVLARVLFPGIGGAR